MTSTFLLSIALLCGNPQKVEMGRAYSVEYIVPDDIKRTKCISDMYECVKIESTALYGIRSEDIMKCFDIFIKKVK